mmetsp:Transcript_141463/g.439705  ORF Transcript_141463/g.439705 Transcript_141463/m.439705 type:complete len:230 (-) Transcript_141463:436-1125(-)
MVDLDLLLPQLLLCVRLAVAHGAVLEWGEDRRRDVAVVHELRGSAEEPLRQEAACLDGHGRELRLAVDDVADRMDVRHAGLLVVADELAVALLDLQARRLAVQPAGAAGAAHGHEHSIVDAKLGAVLGKDADLPGLRPLEPGRRHPARKLDAVLLHVRPDHLRAVLVEAPQQDGAHHDGHVEADAGEEAGALQRDVGSADDERLAGRLLLPEDVVRTDAALLRTRVTAV